MRGNYSMQRIMKFRSDNSQKNALLWKDKDKITEKKLIS